MDIAFEQACCKFESFDEDLLDRSLAAFGVNEQEAPAIRAECANDPVHPNHYKLPNGMEVIDVEIATMGRECVMNHCLCTAMEYILRHKGKNGNEDIKKAHWWLSKYIDLLEGKYE